MAKLLYEPEGDLFAYSLTANPWIEFQPVEQHQIVANHPILAPQYLHDWLPILGIGIEELLEAVASVGVQGIVALSNGFLRSHTNAFCHS